MWQGTRSVENAKTKNNIKVYAMKKRYFIRGRRPAGGKDGAVLVLALLTLAMVTVLGVYSATRSSLEQQIANNMENQVMAFFSAEAGISHGRRVMQNEFVKANEQNMVNNLKPNWNFMLNGQYNGIVAGTYWCGDYPTTASNGCEYGASAFDGLWTQHGVQILQNTTVIGVKTVEYTVTVWDNVDHMFDASLYADGSYAGTDSSVAIDLNNTSCVDTGATDLSKKKPEKSCPNDYDPVNDKDGMIFVRSKGIVYLNGVEVSEAIHELTFQGQISGKGQIIPGLAQEFANEGHSSSGMDLEEIDAADLNVSADIST
ncbi:MAG: hypothetical protein OEZ28_13790 [Nitrospinota bacterium]|nr:hypothetical protein [Nitrospinota bacterium]